MKEGSCHFRKHEAAYWTLGKLETVLIHGAIIMSFHLTNQMTAVLTQL